MPLPPMYTAVIEAYINLAFMKKAILLVHNNGKSRQLIPGFCWLGFFFPGLWAVSEGLWRPWGFSLLALLICELFFDASKYYGHPFLGLVGLFEYFLLMIVFGIFGKKWLIADMLKHGYMAHNLSDQCSSRQFSEKANTAIGISFALFILGAIFMGVAKGFAMIIAFLSLFVFIWGCGQYAKSKGYSPWFGILGLLLFIGFFVLSWLPDKQKNTW